MTNRLYVLIVAMGSLFFTGPVAAQDSRELKVATYQSPVGFIEYLNENAQGAIKFNQSGWIGVSDADIIVYFMSSFDAHYEITDFGSRILDTIDEQSENAALVTQSVNLEKFNRVVYTVYVSADKLENSREQINCVAGNAVLTLSSNFSDEFRFVFSDCS